MELAAEIIKFNVIVVRVWQYNISQKTRNLLTPPLKPD